MSKFIKKRIIEYKQSRAAQNIIRAKARAAYLKEKENQAIGYAKQRAIIQRQKKEASLRNRPVFYKEAYKAASRLGKRVEPRRAYGYSESDNYGPPRENRRMPVRRSRYSRSRRDMYRNTYRPVRRVKRRVPRQSNNYFYDDSLSGGF